MTKLEPQKNTNQDDYSLYDLFIPLTNRKAFVFISIIGILVYFNALFGAFVWDDIVYIALNPQIHTFNIVALFGESYFNGGSFYRPLAAVYLSALYNLFGNNTFFYHVLQIFVHIVNTCLFFYLLRKHLTAGIAFFLSLIFLVHPIQAESVSYIAGVSSGLVFLCGIGALLLSTRKHVSIKTDLIIAVLLLTALFIKETGLQFLMSLLIFQMIFNRNRIKRFGILSLGVILLYFSFRILTIGIALENTQSTIPIQKLSFTERLMHMPEVIYYYIKTLLNPSQLAYNQQWTISEFTFSTFYFPLLIVILSCFLLLIIGISCYRKNNVSFAWYLIYLSWFLISFGFYIQVIPLDMTVADRWFYIPLAGLLGVLGIGMQNISIQKSVVRNTFIAVGVLSICALSVRTMIRNTNFNTPYSLYANDIAIENNYQNANLLGVDLIRMKRFDEALPYVSQSVRQHPQGMNVYNLGNVYESIEDYRSAVEQYDRVIGNNNLLSVTPEEAKLSHDGKARILLAQNNFAALRDFMKRAVITYPKEGSYWAYLAISEYKLGNYDGALRASNKSVALLPNSTTKQLQRIIKNRKPLNFSLE